MSILLLSCGFLAGMVVTASIFAWDARIKARKWYRMTVTGIDGTKQVWVKDL